MQRTSVGESTELVVIGDAGNGVLRETAGWLKQLVDVELG